jgi:hypothetical protein
MMDGGSSFQETYQCLPASQILLKSLRDSVEFGGKGTVVDRLSHRLIIIVIMPGSALETICTINP